MSRAELSAILKSKRGVPKYKIHKITGLSRTQIDNIESGATNYTIDSLLAYCNAGGIDIMLLTQKARPKPSHCAETKTKT